MSIFNQTVRSCILCIFANLLISSSALAHHGSVVNPNLYLAENLIEIEGEITEVFWRNPHPRYKLEVPGNSGTKAVWELELGGSTLTYRRMGIFEGDIVRVGDKVKVAGFISKSDSNSMGVMHMLLPNGQEFVNGADRALRWSNTRMTVENKDLDRAAVERAVQTASGLFRVWDRVEAGDIVRADFDHLLTAKGRQLADAYDPIADNYELECRQGMPDTMFDRGAPMQLIDQGDRILVRLQEFDIERTIYMNTQGIQPPSLHTSLGHSIGHWEGNDLAVNTSHVTWPYYDEAGVPQSDEATYVERFSLQEGGNVMLYQIAITDPVIFTAPFLLETTRTWRPGLEMSKYECTANWEA